MLSEYLPSDIAESWDLESFENQDGHPFSGEFVQIFDFDGKLPQLMHDLDDDEELIEGAPVDPNGMQGRVIASDESEQTYTVMTFEGIMFKVPTVNVKEYVPPGAEEGGFDVAWPEGPEQRVTFAANMIEQLATKGYCLVQTFTSPEERKYAMRETYDLRQWMLPKKEFEAAYMGFDNGTKYSMLPEEYSQNESSTLGRYDRTISQLGILVEPSSLSMGVNIWGRMNGMVRVPLLNEAEERQLRPSPLAEVDYGDGRVVGHINFLDRRKILFMYWIDNTGGEIELVPNSKGSPVRIPISKNKVLIFRNDLMGYRYRPEGESLALQAWLMSAPPAPNPDDDGVVSLPLQLHGEKAHVTSLMTRYPGESSNPWGFWTLFLGGSDSLSKVPTARWDPDLYYSIDKDKEGCTYALHGAFLGDVGCIDKDQFDIIEEEFRYLSPGQRLVLEVGYEVLHQAGHTKETCNGLKCGVFLGDSGSDWPYLGHAPDPCLCLGMSNYITGSRLSHTLGLQGPCSVQDTACSSSLVAISMSHTAVRKTKADKDKANIISHVNTALTIGLGLLLSPRMYILYCGPHMLSPRGRCFTFDSSADGYARGEGCGGHLLVSGDTNEMVQEMLACLIGSVVNQDGRSASMTAPNGPSQQQCIRASLAESGLSASEISMAECHGTGTALGDPIEVSALRLVMQDREVPVLNSSAKTNIGHLEASAGMAGFIKCIMSIISSCGPPNAHFTLLNPHMDVTGYPVYFESELAEFDQQTGITGVSSFGFGGTNARSDLWGRCMKGHKATQEINTSQWLDERNIYFQRVYHYGSPGPQENDQVCIVGTWDAYSTAKAMTRTRPGEYIYNVVLGDTRVEHFHIVLNHNTDQAFHPMVMNAGQHAEITGPASEQYWKEYRWMINGKADQVPIGTTYQLKFTWSFNWERGEDKKMSWHATDTMSKPIAYKHQYSIVGSWTTWKFQQMVASKTQPGLYTALMRIGYSGQEEFQIARDNDFTQVIHPAVPRARRDNIPVRGPDDQGSGKNWLIRGPTSEVVTIQLRVQGGEITVSTASQTKGVKTWRGSVDDDMPSYYVAGSWSNWNLDPMTPDLEMFRKYTYRVSIGEYGYEEFQIVLERDWDRIVFPHIPQAPLGEGIMCGPNNEGHGLNWLIQGFPGQIVEITFDLDQEDKRFNVTWREVVSQTSHHPVLANGSNEFYE